MLRYLLVFLVGALLGANVAWYYAQNRSPVPPGQVATARAPPPAGTPPAGGRVAGSVPATANTSAPFPHAPAGTVGPPVVSSSGLIIPVAGVKPSQLVDTYAQGRSEGRVHEAIDIMAPEGTPVLAAIDGRVAKLFTSVRGGIAIYQFDPAERRVYYYAHLRGYAAGLADGQMLRQGQVIGYVGSTGNVTPGSPHLHFSVGDLGAEKKYWKSTPVNPFPLLRQ